MAVVTYWKPIHVLRSKRFDCLEYRRVLNWRAHHPVPLLATHGIVEPSDRDIIGLRTGAGKNYLDWVRPK